MIAERDKRVAGGDAMLAFTPNGLLLGNSPRILSFSWHAYLKGSARSNKSAISELSAQGQSALHLVGGLYKLGMATEEELRWIKKEFVAVWKSSKADVQSLLPFHTVDDGQLNAVRSLSLNTPSN